MGALAFKATTIAEFEDAFKKAMESERPCVIDAQIDEDDKVWPMVAAGQPIATCFSEEDLEKQKEVIKIYSHRQNSGFEVAKGNV